MSKWLVTAVLMGTLFLACTVPTLDELNERWGTVPREATVVEFDPTGDSYVQPFPVDLLFLGSDDGTMNVPGVGDGDYFDPLAQMNTLDGFSTLMPMQASFSGRVRESTLVAGDTVRVFEVEKSSAYLAISGIVRELEALREFEVKRTDYQSPVLDESGDPLVGENGELLWEIRHGVEVLPIVPLKPSTSYMVVVGTGVLDEWGHPVEPSLIYGICKGGNPLVDKFGHTTVPIGFDDEEAAMLEQLRNLVNSYEILLGLQAGLGSGSVALAWTYTTQSIEPMLKHIAENVRGANHVLAPVVDPLGAILTTAAMGMGGVADLYAGAIEVPYYLNDLAPGAGDNFWKGLLGSYPTIHYQELTGAGPIVESTQTIPFLVTLPNGMGPPAEGWPVTIFLHDLTQNRFNALAVAEALASFGQAVIAIDLPLHGVNKYNQYNLATGGLEGGAGLNPLFAFSADAPALFETCGSCGEGAAPDAECGDVCGVGLCANPAGGVYANHPSFAAISGSLRERMMGIDTDQDGETDGSGTNFLNFAQGLNLRDNLRQAAADLIVLRKTIPEMGVFDSERVSFLGHGIGASAGVLFLAMAKGEGLYTSAGVLANPLSGIGRALESSALIGPMLKAGLEGMAGVVEGSAEYEQFFMAFQTALDGGDPVNYGASVESPILMFESVGDGADHPSDTYFPVDAGGLWPTSGSTPLANVMGLRPVSASTDDSRGLDVVVRFSKGNHTSLLDPSGGGACPSLTCDATEEEQGAFAECVGPFVAVTTEMQTQMVTFIASGGTAVQVQPSVNVNETTIEIVAEGE